MKNAIHLFFIILILSTSCKQANPNDLRILTTNEIIEIIKNNQIPNPETTVYKDQNGKIIPLSDFQKITIKEEFTSDTYVDSQGEIREFVARKATEEDKVAAKKIEKALEEHLNPEIKTVEIDCAEIKNILQKVYEADQGSRKNKNSYDSVSDHKNLETVISLINQCGMPTLNDVNQTQMDAIWLVIQHAPGKYRKQYIGLLEKAAENGDLQKTNIAMMKDRILMDDGKPQIYGTQISMNQETGEWELYNLENSAYVNQRRKEIGFMPIEEYLTHFNLTFDIPQKEK